MDAPCDAVVVFYLRDGQISGLSYLFGDGPHWEQADLVHVIREGAESEDREPAIVLGVGGWIFITFLGVALLNYCFLWLIPCFLCSQPHDRKLGITSRSTGKD